MWVKIKQYFVNPYGSHQMVIPLAIPVSAFQALNLPVLGNNMEDSEMVLFLLLSQERFHTLLQRLNPVSDSDLFLAAKDGMGLSLNLQAQTHFAQTPSTIIRSDLFRENLAVGQDSGEYYVSFREFTDYPLKLVHLLPKATFGKVIGKVRPVFLVIWLMTSLLAAGMTVLLSDVITKPLLSIIANIAANRRIKKPAKYQDEIGILINTLNQMYDTIDRQIETIRQQAEMVRTAEMQALSQQINPHFLYNVLDSTRWKILAEDKAAATIIEELSAFLRISLNQGKAELTLETEIRHIELYLRIMDQIENHHIELVVDCAEELKKMKIIHLILQPLVENSIKHGFREPFPETIAKCIIIRLAISSDRNHLVLEVTDNGQGMDTAKMEKACTPLQEQGSGGIGLTNVYLRLCRYYNQAIRAEFLSIPYVKNTVRFYLPSGPGQEA